MNNLNTYEAYFQEIVTNYSNLNGFYHIDLFEFDNFKNDLRGGKFQTPLLILETYNTGTLGNGQYNVHDVLSGALVIFGKFDIKLMKVEDKTTFLAEMETITKEVRNKMIVDKHKNCNAMKGLIIESINIAKTETIAGNFQGFRMEFTLELPNEIKLTESDWTNA